MSCVVVSRSLLNEQHGKKMSERVSTRTYGLRGLVRSTFSWQIRRGSAMRLRKKEEVCMQKLVEICIILVEDVSQLALTTALCTFPIHKNSFSTRDID